MKLFADHVKWIWKKLKAALADRLGFAFLYVYPFVGEFIYIPRDHLSWRCYLYGDFEIRELQYAVTIARSGGVVLDIGANIGLYSVACGRVVGELGRVIALEPAPVTFRKFQKVLKLTKLQNVESFQIAAGSRNEKASFWIHSGGMDAQQKIAIREECKGFKKIEVPMVRLDDLCKSYIQDIILMKVDVEGHELEVLLGAQNILRNGRVHLIIEFNRIILSEAGVTLLDLWNHLKETHDCREIISQKGMVVNGSIDNLHSLCCNELVNTIWEPL